MDEGHCQQGNAGLIALRTYINITIASFNYYQLFKALQLFLKAVETILLTIRSGVGETASRPYASLHGR
jgi:hypothetical protein